MPKRYAISLELTSAEAEFLQVVLSLVAGDPRVPPRKHQENISKRLRKATGRDFDDGKIHRQVGGRLYCEPFGPEVL